MKRPAFQELLADIENGLIDIVVVYKVDRLTRSLIDFVKIIDIFDRKQVSFVSITQQFNTTTSMGRLTLNILLSFAQFERELTGERIRDKLAASKKKGMWLSGIPPMGYVKKDGRLEIQEAESKIIKLIFNKYLELKTVPELLKYLNENNVHTRSGKNFYKGHLYKILSNRSYIGKIEHKGNIYEGLHNSIISDEIFERVQTLLIQNSLIRKNGTNADSGSLLKGKLFDDKNNYMSPSHSNKKGRRYRYYVSQALIQNKLENLASVTKISANEIEKFITEKVKELISNKSFIQNIFKDYQIEQQKIIINNLDRKEPDINFIRHIIIKIIISEESIDIITSKELIKEAVLYLIFGTKLSDKQNYDKSSILQLTYSIRISSTARNGKKLIIGNIKEKTINNFLFKAIIKSFYYHKLMLENKLTKEQKENTHIYRLMQLRFLPKNIILDILTGNQEPDLTLKKLYNLCNQI